MAKPSPKNFAMASTVAAINIRSLKKRITELRELVQLHPDIKILAVSETLLKIPDKAGVSIPNFHRLDSPCVEGGARGLSLYFHHSLPAEPVILPPLQAVEALAVKLKNNNGTEFLIVGIYVPGSNHGPFPAEDLQTLLRLHPRTILIGDFNARHNAWGCATTNSHGRNLLLFLDNDTDAYLYHPDEATQVPNWGVPGCIDFALTSFPARLEVGVLRTTTSDHDAVTFPLEPGTSDLELEHFFDFKKADWKLFRATLSEKLILPARSSTTEELDERAQHFVESIQEAMRTAIPRRKGRPGQAPFPVHVRKLLQDLNHARRAFKRDPSEKNRREYFRVSWAAQRARKKHQADEWFRAVNTAEPGWPTVFRIQKVLKRRCNTFIPPIRTAAGFMTGAADKLNTIASTMNFTPPDSTDPAVMQEVAEFNVDPTSWTPQNDADSAPLKLVQPAELRSLLKAIKKHKAPGEDGIPNLVLKNLGRKGFAMLLYLLNSILCLRHFPTTWKRAKTIPLPKPGKRRDDPASYRPIALLGALSKIAEAVINIRLRKLTEELAVIPSTQMGFVRGKGTNEQLLRVVSWTLRQIDKRSWYAGIAALDLTKAFDSIWHEALHLKLHRFGFPLPVRLLIRSYLQGRSFRLHAISTVSDELEIQFGVPQGSILGPLLYIIFTADFPHLPGCQVAMYADDTAILCASKKPTFIQRTLNRGLSTTADYFGRWRLTVNPGKTQVTLFKHGRRSRNPTPFHLSINGTRVDETPTCKYLGITLDKGLHFAAHARATAEKAAAVRCILRPLIGRFSVLPPHLKLHLYKTCLRPIITYASPIWAGQLATPGWARLQAQQNMAIKNAISLPLHSNTADAHAATNMPYLHDFILHLCRRFYGKIEEFLPELLQNPPPRLRRMPQFFHSPRPPDLDSGNSEDEDGDVGPP